MSQFDFNNLRAIVTAAETEHAQSARRKCPDCGKDLVLSVGRVSRKWYWRHLQMTECGAGNIGVAIFFPTHAEAVTATEIFY